MPALIVRSPPPTEQGWSGRIPDKKRQGRLKSGLSQSQFASLLGVSVRTLQDWEQGRRRPSGAAQTLITIAQQQPEVLRQVLQAQTLSA